MKTTLFLIFSLFILSCGDNNNSTSNLNPCSPNQCEKSLIPHKTVCKKISDTDFECICEEGYTDDNGSCKAVEVTPCSPNPCKEEHKTICNITNNDDYTCSCDNGYQENNENCQKLHDFNLRLMAANISSGNKQSYDPGDGIRIFQAIKPDVIMIQEMNYRNNSNSDYKDLAERIFNDTNCIDEQRCYYYAGKGQIPNGILSKYPIIKHGYWDDPNINNRDLNYAIIDLPGNKDLFVISVHLSTKGSKQTRPAGIIAHNVAEDKKANPDKYYYAVGGDLNGPTSVSSDGFGKEYAFNINDSFPKSETGKYGTSSSRKKHHDWLLESNELSNLQISSDFCSEEDETDCKKYTNGLVMDTREYTSEQIHKYFPPAKLEDSGATNMQHMAVIKDFKITLGD